MILGTPYSSWQDVLFINWFVQLLSMFTSYAYLVYLVIPGYVTYHYGGWVDHLPNTALAMILL